VRCSLAGGSSAARRFTRASADSTSGGPSPLGGTRSVRARALAGEVWTRRWAPWRRSGQSLEVLPVVAVDPRPGVEGEALQHHDEASPGAWPRLLPEGQALLHGQGLEPLVLILRPRWCALGPPLGQLPQQSPQHCLHRPVVGRRYEHGLPGALPQQFLPGSPSHAHWQRGPGRELLVTPHRGSR